MADEELLDEGSEEGLPKAKSPVAKILMTILGYLIPVLISVVISVIIMFVVFKGGVSQERSENAIVAQLQPKPAPLSYYDLGEFRINTADLDANYFMRVALSLGYDAANKQLHSELVARHTQIRDVILNLLNSKEKNQIDEFLEKEQLKEEIRRTINSLFINGEVGAVYYTEFTVS
ncbi:MAG: flagellar basal body-associated FliL family protein [Brevinema sp.]